MVYNALGDLFYLTFRALNGGNSSLVLFHRYCQERGIPYGGGVGQKFKPPLSKLVSDWVSSIAHKLTILVLRIFFFREIVVLLCSYLSFFIAFCLCVFSFIRSPCPFQSSKIKRFHL